eukprot:NODE_3502_length_1339_cov_51.055921_g3060_i0.p1 GENE.NODE_3502_length_1339_cov_51.055921_g3060_i0~~NODE_3502_length_1339_cov_51.055921_g3060_i0.p1  ORF type:complete len:135 (+),score=8.17 NODE_3502_length_1339_cov_51.055921_g3060_i0:55-459(+)
MNSEPTKTIESPRKPKHHFAEYRDDTCPICLEKYDDTYNPSMLYFCGHGFHLQCAESWRQRSNACPLCWSDMIEVGVVSQQLAALEDTPIAMGSFLRPAEVEEDLRLVRGDSGPVPTNRRSRNRFISNCCCLIL